MAKSRTDDEAKLNEELLTGLRRALDGQPHLLQGTEEKQALFPTGKRGEKLAQQALAARYLEPAEPPEGVKASKTAKFVRLTDQGRQFLQQQDDPRRVLETLLPLVQQIAARVDRMAIELQQNLSPQLAGMARVLEQTQDMIEGVLESDRETAADLEPAASLADEEEDESDLLEDEGAAVMEEEYDEEELPPPVPEDEPLYRQAAGARESVRSTAGEERLPEQEPRGYGREEERPHEHTGHPHRQHR